MLDRVKRVREFLGRGLWHEIPTPSRLRAAALHIARVLTLSVRSFLAGRCMVQATALAYATLLSLVPLLAFAFSVAKGFGLREQIWPVIEKWLVANQKEVGDRITQYVKQTDAYIEATNVNALGTIGLLFLIWTTLKVLSTIEKSFNQIWGIEQSRTFYRRFTDYTSVLVTSPILLLAAISSATAIQSSPLVRSVLANATLGRLAEFLLVYATTWVAFAAVYIFMPNTRVRWISALTGGVIAGTIWQLAFWFYTVLQVGMARYNAIYGTFAALPVFMIWIYVSWAVVLFGAEVSWAVQNVGRYWEERRTEGANFATRETVALRTMVALAVAFHRDGVALTPEQMAERIRVPTLLIRDLLPALVAAGLCKEVVGRRANAFVPGRPLEHITPAHVVAAVRDFGQAFAFESDCAEAATVTELVRAWTQSCEASLSTVTLRDIAARVAQKA